MIRGIDHLNIVVTDLERSVRFYTGLLGFRQTAEVHLEGDWIGRIVGLEGVKARAVFIEPPGGGPRIELLQYSTPTGHRAAREFAGEHARAAAPRVPRRRYCGAIAATLRGAGVTLFSDPVRVPAGVVKFAAGDKTLVYFLDPDGVILELAEYR
jgi:glyoxylase I family protein